MSRLVALPLAWLVLLVAGCSQTPQPLLPLRALSSEAPQLELDEPEHTTPTETREVSAPRIGAPGGSGAGTRSVQPALPRAQSGNDTVGGLPAGIGAGTGPRG
jgi:hypothetical protein